MGGEEEEEEEDGLSGQPIDKRLNCEFGSDWLRRQLRAQKEKNVEWPGPPPFRPHPRPASIVAASCCCCVFGLRGRGRDRAIQSSDTIRIRRSKKATGFSPLNSERHKKSRKIPGSIQFQFNQSIYPIFPPFSFFLFFFSSFVSSFSIKQQSRGKWKEKDAAIVLIAFPSPSPLPLPPSIFFFFSCFHPVAQ